MVAFRLQNETIPDQVMLAALSLGQLAPDVRLSAMNGRNPDSAAGVTEDVWEGGGTYAFQSTAVALEVLSASAADAAAGTGARTVAVSGLDANGAEIAATATLSGVTPVALGSFWRVNSAVVLTSGSGGTNAGDVTIRTVSGSTAQCIIAAGRSYSQQMIFTVPAGHSAITSTFYFAGKRLSGAAGNTMQVFFQRRLAGSNTWITGAEFLHNDESTVELRPVPYGRAHPALSDLKFSALCSVAMTVTAGMGLLLVKDGVSFVKALS